MTPAGRPEIGTPINVRLGDELLTEVDEYADKLGVSRAEAIRQLIKVALIRPRQPDPYLVHDQRR